MKKNVSNREAKRPALRKIVARFMMKLAYINVMFKALTKGAPHNIMLYIFEQIETLLSAISKSSAGNNHRWIRPEVMDNLVAGLASAINTPEVPVSRVLDTMRNFEQVSWHWINKAVIVRSFIEEEGCQFDCFIRGNITSNQYLKALFSAKEKLWEHIRDIAKDCGPVEVYVVDAHLNTPSSCIILIQFLFQLQTLWHIRISNIEINLADYPIASHAEMRYKELHFNSVSDKVWFMRQMLQKVLGAKVRINRVLNLQTPQGIFLKCPKYQLDIGVDEGISYYWEASDHGDVPEKDKLWKQPLTVLCLKNIATDLRQDRGIFFKVKFSLGEVTVNNDGLNNK